MQIVDMEGSRYRVSVSLKSFFSDERALCYLSVESNRPIQWLRQRLRRLFPAFTLGRFALTCKGRLLPDDEPISLLDPDDTVFVVPVEYEIPGEKDAKNESEQLINDKAVPSIDCKKNKRQLDESCSQNVDKACGNINIKKELMHQNLSLSYESKNVQCSNEANSSNEFEIDQETTMSKLSEDDHLTNLLEMKQRALHLLDQFDEPQDDSTTCQRNKRRRVRRGKRRRPNGLLSNQPHAPNIRVMVSDSSQSECPLFTGQDLSESSEHQAPVLRNSTLNVRSARVVQPLSAETVFG